jgi:hypothetical protein
MFSNNLASVHTIDRIAIFAADSGYATEGGA